jgi:Subtilisin-like serine proteases
MKKLNLFLAICIAGLLATGCTNEDAASSALKGNETALVAGSTDISNKYIVVINEKVDLNTMDIGTRKENVKLKAQGLLKKYGITGDFEDIYESALQGFTVRLSPGQAKQLAKDSYVKSVEPDAIISLSPISANGKPAPAPVAQSVPWGITRVGGGVTLPVSGVAWIIDTGIDMKHPDLKVDASRSVTFLGGTTTPDDENGHGTHVSGTIAAINNSIGVVGVAPGATLIAVRVLDKRGSGTVSGVIAGVNYVAAHGVTGDVANMSLGGGISSSLDAAVLGASANVKFAIAAGNSSDNVVNYSPARVNGLNVYTVSAMDSTDKWASFSNWGNPTIDYCAPGVSVYSTYKGQSYATLSGTSMATPHVAGLLLIGAIKTDGYVKYDPDGTQDPIAHH